MKKKNNKGYSLVELLTALAVFSIVMIAIILLMRSSIASYREGLYESKVQEDAQLVANQVCDMLIDAKHYKSGWSFVGADGDFNLALAGKTLTVNSQTLSNDVSTFSITGLTHRTSQTDTAVYDNQATVEVGIEYKGKTYTASKAVHFRNNIEDEYYDGTNFFAYNPYDVKYNSKISGGSVLTDEVTVLRYEPYVLASNLNPTETRDADKAIVYDCELSTDANNYFMITHALDADPLLSDSNAHPYAVRVKPALETNVAFWGEHCENSDPANPKFYAKGKNASGNEVVIPLKLEPVSFDNGVGIYSTYREAHVSGNGYPTNIIAKGININKALDSADSENPGVITLGYSIKMTRESVELGTASGTVPHNSNTFAKAGNVFTLSPISYKMGLVADPLSSGLVLFTDNGQAVGEWFNQNHNVDAFKSKFGDSRSFLDTADGKTKLELTFTFNGEDYSDCDLTYKFCVVGNSLSELNTP